MQYRYPDKFAGNENMRHFQVECSEIEAEMIADILFDAEASSVPNDGIATSETYKYVNLVNIWSKLTEYVSENV